MLAIERRKVIMGILQENNSVMVPDLSKRFDVTEETIRRDLEKLEKEGFLKRTYGGAVLNESTNVDIPLNIREITNIEGKQAIALKVAEYIEDGDAVILDSSSTTLQVAEKIKHKKNLTVITNSIKVVSEMADAKSCKIISTGGILRESAMSFVGRMAEDAIKKYNVDKAIICCKGIDKNKNITESNEMESEVKKAITDSADKVYLVVDSTKFDRVAFIKMLDISKIDVLFTDKKLSSDWEQHLKNLNVKIEYC